MKHHAKQIEATFEDEPFALVPQSALDGGMIAARMAARERNRAAWEAKHQPLPLPKGSGEEFGKNPLTNFSSVDYLVNE